MRFLLLMLSPLLAALICGCGRSPEIERPRLLVTTDIGGDPDDLQSLIRLLVYANEFEIEGLIASSSGILGQFETPRIHPEVIRETVAAYGRVLPNLQAHAGAWPSEASLLSVVKEGNPLRGRDNVGPDHDTEASSWIIERVDAASEANPLNISIWGGQTDLAQALWRVREDRGPGGLARFVSRMRVFDVADQDRLAGWMRTEFPGMHYVLSSPLSPEQRLHAAYRGMYLGGDESLTSVEWVKKHVKSKGPLGELYPMDTWTDPNPHGCLKEGDTPAWFFFLPQGGNSPGDPSKPGWGGQYWRSSEGWYRDFPAPGGIDPRETVSRWRPEFQKDFAKRMSWCQPQASARAESEIMVQGQMP